MTGAEEPVPAGQLARVVRGIWAASAAAALVFLVTALAGDDGSDAQTALLIATVILAAAAPAARALPAPKERIGWLLLAGAILGFGYTGAVYLGDMDQAREFPSIADFGATGYLLGAISFVLFARRELSGLPRALWLDAAIGGLALAAVGVVSVHAGFAGDAEPTLTERGQLLYIAAALLLAGFVFVAWGLGGFRRSTLFLLGVGAACFGVSDAIYGARLFEGQIDWPAELAAVWAAGIVTVSACAAVHRPTTKRAHPHRWSLVSVPVVAALVAVVIHVTDHGRAEIAMWLATTVLLLSVARLAISLFDNQRAAERRLREEEERRAREQAEQANRAKTAFLSRMSHEVRTPLNSILGFAQLLIDDLEGTERGSVERILRAGNHLRQLIDDILDLSSIEAGETAIQLEPVDLESAVDESIALMEPMGRRSNVRIARRDVDGAPRVVFADAHRLKQALLNLISNAIKYGGSDAEVIVRAEGRGELVRVSVIDAGPGIADEHLPKLFTPFERGSARGSGIEGSGLGLALTKNLVEAMGGSIGVQTGPGGSIFHIDLPVSDAPVADAEAVEPQSRPVRDDLRVVLYIEDHLSNVALVERLLARREEYELVTATTGRAGLKLAETLAPDVVLLDLDLPDLRGEDVLAELRAESRTSHIPVIVVSADATAWRRQDLLRAGAVAYMVKPLHLDSFLSTLDGVLNRSPAPS